MESVLVISFYLFFPIITVAVQKIRRFLMDAVGKSTWDLDRGSVNTQIKRFQIILIAIKNRGSRHQNLSK
jgi:hypothetical protein